MNSDLSGLLGTIICCFGPLVFIGLILFLIFSRRNPTTSDNLTVSSSNNFLLYLKDLKKKGIVTIDEAIESLESKPLIAPEPPKQEIIQPKTQVLDQQIQQPAVLEKPQKSVPKVSSAEVLLYIGSFLITFAMLVLVALGWSTIPGIAKTIVLFVTVLGFFVGGMILARNQKLKNVGVTYLTVASLATPLAFLGLWNFSFDQNLVNFSLYWTIVSVLVIAMNVFLSSYLAKKRFFYLIQIAIYSLFISFAFTLTDDSNFRIIIIAVLNLCFYFSDKIFGNYGKEVKYISRAVNFVLNFVILFAVSGLVNEISTDYQRILATIALLIPTVFIVASYIKDNANIETGFELVLFLGKMILVAMIFQMNNDTSFIFFNTLPILYILIAEFILIKRSKVLFFESIIVSLLILFVINISVWGLWIAPSPNPISNYSILYSLIATSFCLLFIPLKREKYKILGFGLLYLIFAFSRILGFFVKDGDFLPYIYSYLVIGILFGLTLIYSLKNNKHIVTSLIRPIAEVLPVLTILTLFLKFEPNHIATVYLSLAAYYLFRSLILKSKIERYVSYTLILIGYLALLSVFNNYKIISLPKPENYSIGLLFLSITLFVISEIKNYFKLNRKPEDYAVTLYSIAAVLLSIFVDENYLINEKYLWVNLAVITVFLVIRFSYRLTKVLLTSIYLLIQVLIILGMPIIGKFFEDTSWVLTFLNMAILLIVTFINIKPNKVINERINSLLRYFSSLVAVIVVLLIPITLGTRTEILWFNLLTLFIYSILKVIELRKKEILVLSFILLNTLVLVGSNIYELSYLNTLLTFAITNLVVISISKLPALIKESDELKTYSEFVNDCSSIFAFMLLAFTILSSVGIVDQLTTIVYAIIGLNLLISDRRIIQKLSGISFVLMIWNLNSLSNIDLNIQFYIVPITIYGLILAGVAHLEGKRQESELLETISYSFQMLTLLFQSIASSTDSEKIISGIVLIGLSVVFIVLGLFREKKFIWIIAAIFLFLELLVRFYVVILLIPWWIYIALIGIGLIVLASYIIYRNSNK